MPQRTSAAGSWVRAKPPRLSGMLCAYTAAGNRQGDRLDQRRRLLATRLAATALLRPLAPDGPEIGASSANSCNC